MRDFTPSFDPHQELQTYWPDWRVCLVPLSNRGEMFDLRHKLIRADPCRAGERWTFAHVLAHLRMGHQFTAPGRFSEAQCAAADRDAEKRIVSDLYRQPVEVNKDPSGQMPVFRP